MGFNIPLFKTMGRGWGRGSPPPRGSIEWAGVADMWEPDPPRSSSGFQVFEIGFTELDAADRWMKRLYENIRYARQVHGDKILSAADVVEWDALMERWVPFRDSLKDHAERLMLKENKAQLDGLLHESKKLHDKFTAKGMPMVTVPYMGELVLLLRQMPKKLTASQMHAKLEAGIDCGDKLLDENTAWWQWHKRATPRPWSPPSQLPARPHPASSPSRRRHPRPTSPGDPAYDEFIRRLTKIWIEAAGLYGIIETEKTAVAEGLDAGRKAAQKEEERAVETAPAGRRGVPRDPMAHARQDHRGRGGAGRPPGRA